MTPTIQVPVEHTFNILENVLKKRTHATRVLKEREEQMPSGEDYDQMEVNLDNEPFLQPLDADDTKASIYYARQKWTKYCKHRHLGHWRTAIRKKNCGKGKMMLFLHWICKTSLASRRKRGSKRSLHTYWRDFKMLYRRVNGEYVDANDRHEVVKYIDGTLKVEFKLRTTSKPKPVAGPDDLLLLLVQHWARDESVFPTEDDRHDVATIMLFQAYTGGRPAEFVHASKGKASEDPLGEREEANKNAHPRKATHCDHDEDSDADIDGETECGDGSNADDGPGSDDDMIFDSEDDRSDDGTADEDMDEYSGSDSGYNSDRTDVTMTEDTDKCYTTEIDECGEPLRQKLDAAKPSEFEEVKRQYKALCYEDICLWIVQNPKRGERDVLAMEVHLQNHKGVDNKPKPTTFLFRENPLPILCPISHILARAIRDNAILVDGYTSAEPFFATDLGSQNVKAMKVHWKPEWLKQPVFRRSVWTTNGWVKSKTEPMAYSKYAFYLNRLGRDAGFEDKLTSYCFRRGCANAIDGKASDAVRDQVMRHNPFTGVFNEAYNNQAVRFNVQDAYLESDITDDGLTRAFTHMSIRCNPGAPKEVPREVMNRLLAVDPEIAVLERQFKESHTRIKWEYKFINRAPKEIRETHKKLGQQLKAATKSLEDELEAEHRKDYFFYIHNEMMKRQLNRPLNETVEEAAEPVIEHQLEERTRLQLVLCDLSKDLSPQAIVARKVSTVNLQIALVSRKELMTRQRRSAPTCKDPLKGESPICAPIPTPALDPLPPASKFPLVCKKTQCIFCIGDEALSYGQRTRKFRRPSHMWDHVENIHLRDVPAEQQIICHHPICKAGGLILDGVMLFKNHVATVHEVRLRPNVFPR
ncbi:hypothetical protein DL98DRAFT_578123 [Cadophora sp. DSE1049]|nr:hypothetical protein DL98DRAFT_578123 [Cadophora sp. DSE1049]